MTLPALAQRDEIHKRLEFVFPEGSPHRGYCTRELAASTVFAALYVGAIAENDTWFAPKHVYRMTDAQASKTDDKSRARYATDIVKPGFVARGRRWYSDNTREPIRDETLRDGLIPVGAVIERKNVPTTSSKPRYALAQSFAHMFDPHLDQAAFQAAAAQWQAGAFSKGALARIAIVRRGAVTQGDHVLVAMPNGQTRQLSAGPSSNIAKAVIENFSPRFLKQPAVLFISESNAKIVARDDDLAREIGLHIDAAKDLPDIILVDVGRDQPLIVFVEVVATDGPINSRRKEALEQIVRAAGYPLEHVAFVTAYLDRSAQPFRKTVGALAWGSFAWFVSEPEGLVELTRNRSWLIADMNVQS